MYNVCLDECTTLGWTRWTANVFLASWIDFTISFIFKDGKVRHFLILKERKQVFGIRVTPFLESVGLEIKACFEHQWG